MTTGIYILKFNGTDKVYIGQSVNIEGRYKSHCTNMRIGKTPKKLLSAYNQYGLPYIEVLLECSKEELDANEEEAISIFDSVANGFNTMRDAGFSSELYGEECGNAKYTNETIIEVFNYLTNCTDLTHADIVNITGVSKGTVADISMCESHKWLKSMFPEQYQILEELHSSRRKLRRTAKSRGIEYPKVVSPSGDTFTIESIRGFAREHNLNPNCFGRVLRGQAISHGGWKLA